MPVLSDAAEEAAESPVPGAAVTNLRAADGVTRWGWAAALCLVAVAGCASVRPPTGPLEFPGFSIVAPQGDGWERQFYDEYSAVFVKFVGTWPRYKLVLATARVFRVRSEFASLLERLDRGTAEPVDPRALGLDDAVPITGLAVALDPALGRGCVRYQGRVPGRIRVPDFRIRGVRCLHPHRPEAGIALSVEDQSLEDEGARAVALEVDAFLRSLVVTTGRPLLPLVLARIGVWHGEVKVEWKTLAMGAGAVWGCETFDVVKMDRSTGAPLALIEPDGGRCLRLAIGARAVWAVRGPRRAVDHEHSTGVLRIDPRTERVVATIPVPAWQIAADEGAVWTVGPGGLSRIDPETNEAHTVLAASDVTAWGHEPPPWMMRRPRALEPFSRILLVASAGDVWALSRSQQGILLRIDGRTGRVVASIAVGGDASSIGMGADAVWITRWADGTAVRVNLATNRIDAVIPVGARPTAVTATPGGVWVAHQGTGANGVSRIDPGTNRVTATVPVGNNRYEWSEWEREPVLSLAVDQESVWVQFPSGVVRVDPEGEVALDRKGQLRAR
jgi:hypothetical protein